MSFRCEEEHILSFAWNRLQKGTNLDVYTVVRQVDAAGWQHRCNTRCRFTE